MRDLAPKVIGGRFFWQLGMTTDPETNAEVPALITQDGTFKPLKDGDPVELLISDGITRPGSQPDPGWRVRCTVRFIDGNWSYVMGIPFRFANPGQFVGEGWVDTDSGHTLA